MRMHAPGVAASFLIAGTTAIVILAVAILLFLNPVWVLFEQGRTTPVTIGGVGFWSGVDRQEVTSAILGDLVLWRGDFEVAVRGEPVLTEAERGHMLDVRRVFALFGIVALVSALGLAVAHGRLDRPAVWRAVRGGAIGLVAALAGAGLVAAVAFDAAFAVFHQLFFSGGNWAFDPATSRLVQLFPMQFWFETTLAVGVVAGIVAVGTAVVAGRRIGPPVDRRVGVAGAVRVPR